MVEQLVEFFRSLQNLMGEILVPLALGAGNIVTLILVIAVPASLVYCLARLVSWAMKKYEGRTDAIITMGIFALAISAALGSLFGIAFGAGDHAMVIVVAWTLTTALSFGLGCYRAVGARTAVYLACAIPFLSFLLGLTIYAS